MKSSSRSYVNLWHNFFFFLYNPMVYFLHWTHKYIAIIDFVDLLLLQPFNKYFKIYNIYNMFTKFVYYSCKTIMKVPLYVFTFALSVLIQITIILSTYCIYKSKFNLRLIIIHIRNINNNYIYIFFIYYT